jgi:hypothetical protein
MVRSTLRTRSLDNEIITACNEYIDLLAGHGADIALDVDIGCDNARATHAVYNAF